MSYIEFRDLPTGDSGFSQLFIDYVTDYENVKKFYSGNFRRKEDWKDKLEAVSRMPRNRSAITQILSVQNRNFHCGVKTLANIDLLHNDNTVAVVTGQQVGLFTGPLYTIYKTITVLKLVEQLRTIHPDYHFVPVFWLEGEDHDYDEVSSIRLLNRTNDLVKLDYRMNGLDPEKNPGAVGILEFSDDIEQFFQLVDQSLSDTEFKPKVLQLFRTAYQRGMTFNRAFVHLMNDLLEESGLIFLDPHDNELKKLLAPVFQKEIQNTPKHCQLVIDQSAQLEKQYHAQIKPKPLNLFLFHQKGRYLIEPRVEGGFALKGTRRHLTKEDLDGIAANSPELLSPNVVLRPICQDWLLPTVAYVGGPSEIAYFAQLKPLYEEFGIPEPIIYPRASATIVEEKVAKVIERFSLQVTDFFQDVELIKRRVTENSSGQQFDEVFGGTMVTIQESLARMRPKIEELDPTLVGALENASKKIEYQIEQLKLKAIAAQARKNEVTLRQIDKAALHLFPESVFQERALNILYFLNKYGLEFLRWLKSELVIDKFKHQVINLEAG
ncbi:MAG TPA: bacillithiol biosynthesis cysteine-adding enzyme BshC [Bacteroidota bacterium]|nr:bacillithiol biosynthesis cysteine-adding enzyme BshC [Bacteroidota bacterium]